MEMKAVARECECRAAEFREKAEEASRSNRMFFLELEQHWLHLACIYYQTDRTLQALRYLGTDEPEGLNTSGHDIIGLGCGNCAPRSGRSAGSCLRVD